MMMRNTMKSSRKMSSMVSQAIRPTAKYIFKPWWLHQCHTSRLFISNRSSNYDSDMLIGREVEILSDGERRRSDQQRRQRVGVPRGSLAVYVGPEERRYVIPTRYLNMPEFGELMERVAEEFGYDQQEEGGLRIPNCQVEDFEKIILLARAAPK